MNASLQWKCCFCEERYYSDNDAAHCCSDIESVWVCGECDQDCLSEASAEECCQEVTK